MSTRSQHSTIEQQFLSFGLQNMCAVGDRVTKQSALSEGKLGWSFDCGQSAEKRKLALQQTANKKLF